VTAVNRRVLLVGLGVVVALLAVLALNLGRDPHSIATPMIGRVAPTFTLTPVDGGAPVSLAALRGKPVVINFWATWCVPCFEEHATLTAAAREQGDKVHFVGVVYEDDPQQVREFLTRQGRAYPALVDVEGKTAMAYGIYGVPETFFVDPSGKIAAKYTGPLTRETLAENLAKAAGGKS
jgi:cytochrome c biogenesis protein CcmG/thiol:disulfide interchange protein DsbE